MENRLWIWDIETYPNLAVFVFKPPGGNRNSFKTFIIYDHDDPDKRVDEGLELLDFITTPGLWFVGYNSIGFDAPILEEFIRRNGQMDAEDIKMFANRVIESDKPLIWPSSFKTLHIDLYKIWSYNNPARRTSLKWLEFTLREKMIKDLPIHHTKKILPSQINKVVVYCKHDVDKTDNLYKASKAKMQARKDIVGKYRDKDFINLGDTNLGEHIFLHEMSKALDVPIKELKKKRTPRSIINVENTILPYIEFDTPEFNSALEFYKGVTLHADKDGLISLKKVIDFTFTYQGIDYVLGAGGLHASVHNKHVKLDPNQEMRDVDVSSYYPNLSIQNGFFPAQLSAKFCDVYSDIYDTRKTFKKGTTMNLAYKLALNSAFGKSNSRWSFLYDPMMTLLITVNGQLSLLMLIEKLSQVSEIIQCNTDGVTVRYQKKDSSKIDAICDWWQELTKLELEDAFYDEMVIRDVNNYWARYTDGSVKRKGIFEIYEDYVKNEQWHKNPSNLVIPKAWNAYYGKGVPINDTIYSEKNIHEFLQGFKKKSNFMFLLLKPDENGFVELTKNEDRVIRYYAAAPGHSLYKLYNDSRVTTLGSGNTFQLLQNVQKLGVEYYPDLNHEWYINQAQELIDSIETI